MEINKVSIEDLNDFYATKQAIKPAEEQPFKPASKPDSKPTSKPTSKQASKPTSKPAEKPALKWGDEAVELDEQEEASTKSETSDKEEASDKPEGSWACVIKKHTPPQPKQTAQKAVAKAPKEEEDNREVIYTVQEFIQCIKQKKKLHVDFVIHPSGHCPHTFNGTLCENVKECGMIHVQRCINNLDCKYKNCQFLHADDMEDDEAYENYMYTMDEYNKIKKNKQVHI